MYQDPFCKKLGIDLVEAAKNELEFLRRVDEYPANLYKGPILKNAIRRYEVFWMPLASKEGYGIRFLAAPLDVAWVWHVHMLAPYYYEQDCINCVSKIVDHVPLGGVQLKDGLQKAKYIWEMEYPDEPFEIDLNQPPNVLTVYKKSKIQYDLEEACYRQSKFSYQVSLPHYKDAKFLEKAVERYEHHIQLKKQNPKLFAVPCYDFDLIWHVHQLHPVNYNQTTTQFLGRLLHHDDTVTSRNPGSKLHDSEMETREVWKAAGLHFVKSGAMYRGNPPDPVPPRPTWLYAPLARCECIVDVLQVETFNMAKKTFLIQLFGPKEQEILSHSFKGNRAVKNLQAQRFTVDNDKRHTITALIYRRTLFFQKRFVTQSTVSVLPILDASPVNDTTTASIGISFNDEQGQYTAQVTIRINLPTIQKYSFKVRIGTFHSEDHPIKQLSNPQLVLSSSDLTKSSLPCSAATQSMLDWRDREAFKYRIVHSSVGLISAVEIINLHQQVVASAHTINATSLPETNDVTNANKCIVLNQAKGERAMLIRGQKDWAVCVGKWQQQIDPRFERLCRFGPKFVSIRVFKLYGKQGWCFVKKSAFGTFVIKMDSNTVIRLDLRKSKIFVSPQAQAIPEALAFALSVAILHLLCMPYLPKPSMESSPTDQICSINTIISPIFYAVGYSCCTVPTNMYIKYVLGEDEGAPGENSSEVACYDFNKDQIRNWNIGPAVQRMGDSGATGDAWKGLGIEENDDHKEGDASFGHGGRCVGVDFGENDSGGGEDTCSSGSCGVCDNTGGCGGCGGGGGDGGVGGAGCGGGDVCGASGGCASGYGGGCGSAGGDGEGGGAGCDGGGGCGGGCGGSCGGD